MTEFGKFLGWENGKTMLCNVFETDCTKEQARAAITTFCIIFDVEVDGAKWDELMRWVYEYYNSWFDRFYDMDMFMCADLV